MSRPAQPWSLPQPQRPVRTAVLFLLRGRDAGYEASYRRFLDSYSRHPAGLAHAFVLVCKGFDTPDAQARAEADFSSVADRVLSVEDTGFDLGAYRDAAAMIDHERVCVLNGYSEILSPDWLLKLTLNLDRPGVGLVGATGSLERMLLDRRFGPFPNVHLRSNAFLIDRELLLSALGTSPITKKLDAFLLESGPASLTRHVLSRGLDVLIVGADARGYPPWLWPRSRTFRLGGQENLLVADNQTRFVASRPWRVRALLARSSWGRYLGDPVRFGSADDARSSTRTVPGDRPA